MNKRTVKCNDCPLLIVGINYHDCPISNVHKKFLEPGKLSSIMPYKRLLYYSNNCKLVTIKLTYGKSYSPLVIEPIEED